MPRQKQGYNFKKAFYGKANRQMSSRINQTLRKDLGSLVNKAYGAAKNKANSALSSYISGSGDYHIHNPTESIVSHHKVGRAIYSGSAHRPVHNPRVIMKEKGQITICHSEYIGELISSNITGSTNFVSQAYGLNPGNPGTFPWLSGIAINFQDYKFKKLVFEYRPLISESTSTSSATLTSMGSVIMATQYDSTQGVYPNKPQMENSDFSISTKPSEKALMAVECNSRHNPLGTLYISGQTNPVVGAVPNSDIRFQDLGIFQIASSNIPIVSNTSLDLGEIWVHYEVTMKKPQLNAGLSNILSAHYISNSQTGAPATITPFGPNVSSTIQPTATANNYLPLTFLANGTVIFPLAITEGTFLMVYSITGGITTPSAAWQGAQNCTLLKVWNQSGAADQNLSQTGGGVVNSGNYIVCCLLQINAPGANLAQITLASTLLPTAGLCDLFVTQYNSTMLF